MQFAKLDIKIFYIDFEFNDCTCIMQMCYMLDSIYLTGIMCLFGIHNGFDMHTCISGQIPIYHHSI